jgi:hypothetical protein
MSFVFPQFLWFLSLLAIPILIHLYRFRRYKTLYFSSLQFLKKVDQETRSTKSVKHLLLLISRLLLLASIVIAFAQPFIPSGDKGAENGRPALLIYLDNSFSMTQKGVEGELFSEAREAARRIIQKAPNNSIILLLSNAMSGNEQRFVSKAEAEDRLDKLKIEAFSRNLGDIIALQQKCIKQYQQEKEAIGQAQVVLLSDFQKNAVNLTGVQLDTLHAYFPVKFVAQEQVNISIDSVWFTEPNTKYDKVNELNIRLKNFGEKEYLNAQVNLNIGQLNKDIYLDIPSKESVVTTFSYTELKSLGTTNKRSAKLSLRDGALNFDNEFFFNYEVIEQANVLIVNGPDSVSNIRALYNLDDFFQSKSVDQFRLTKNELKGQNLIVLNGVNEISSGLLRDLQDFKYAQGTLLFFPGTKLSTSSWNMAAAQLGLPLFSQVNTSGLKIQSIAYQDVFFKPVFDSKPTNLSINTVLKSYNVQSNQSIPLVKFQNGQALFSSSLDRKAFAFSTALKDSFSQLVKNDLFVSTLLRTGEMSSSTKPLFMVTASDSKYPIDIDEKQSPPHLRMNEFDFIPQIERKGSQSYISLKGVDPSSPLKAGQYKLVSTTDSSTIALNYNRQESDIQSVNNEKLVESLSQKGLKNIYPQLVNNGQSSWNINIEKPREYWRWFLIVGLFFLLVEMALIRFWN